MTAANDEGQLLSLAAHELRSPASVVAGYLRLLLKGDAGELNAAQRRLVEDANRSCARVLQLARECSELAALSRADPGPEPHPVQIFALCDEVVRAAAQLDAAATDIVFTCSAADQSAIVNGDAERLRLALKSFIVAERRERGTPELEAHGFVHRGSEPARAIIVLGNQGNAARSTNVFVEAAAVFERWRGGMGLAVPLACSIIEAHGGKVWAVQGATVLGLPLAEPAR